MNVLKLWKIKYIALLVVALVIVRAPLPLDTDSPECVPFVDSFPFGPLMGAGIVLQMWLFRKRVKNAIARGAIGGIVVYVVHYMICFFYYRFMYEINYDCFDFYHVTYTYIPDIAFVVHLACGTGYGAVFGVLEAIFGVLEARRGLEGAPEKPGTRSGP